MASFFETTPASASSTSAPWSGAIPYINQGLQGASNLYNQGGPAYYPGQTYAGANQQFQTGINSLGNTASMFGNTNASDNPAYSYFQGMTQGQGPGMDTLNKYSRGDYLSAQNPYFQQMADTVRGQVLPGLNAQFAGAGRGNSGLAARAAGLGLGDAIGGLAYQNYQQGLGQQQNAANSLANFGAQGASGMSNIYNNNITNRINAGNAGLLAGTAQQGLEQGYLTDAQKRWDYNAGLPQSSLQNYLKNIGMSTQGTGEKTSTETPAQPSFWNQLLGTGLGIASFFA